MARMSSLSLSLMLAACSSEPRVVRVGAPGGDASGARKSWGGSSEAEPSSVAPGEPAGPGRTPAPGVPETSRVRYCDDHPESGFLSPWYAFSDADIAAGVGDCTGGGASVVQLHVPADGPAAGWCPTGMEGRLDAAHPDAYAGMGVRFDMRDLRGFEGFVLATRGDGGVYRADLVDVFQDARSSGCSSAHGNHPGTDFRCGDGGDGWTEVPIRFSALAQRPGWGEPHTLQLRDLRKLSIVYGGGRSADPNPADAPQPDAFACEVAVVRWVAGSGSAR
ncbi:MAG: hypothetical protein VX000_00160 [Myxococcota bacterium]|nr:hypothetical protein [Myxococcota bacterium]